MHVFTKLDQVALEQREILWTLQLSEPHVFVCLFVFGFGFWFFLYCDLKTKKSTRIKTRRGYYIPLLECTNTAKFSVGSGCVWSVPRVTVITEQ